MLSPPKSCADWGKGAPAWNNSDNATLRPQPCLACDSVCEDCVADGGHLEATVPQYGQGPGVICTCVFTECFLLQGYYVLPIFPLASIY